MSQISQALFSAQMITLLLCSFNLFTTTAAPIQLAVNPLIIETELNTWANFTCTLSCEFKDDFRIRWFAGDTTLRGRLIRHGNPSKIIEEGDTCESLGTEGKFWQILRIRVDSIDLNKTPIQCTASPKTSQNTVHFSSYSVLKVKFNAPVPEVKETVPNCHQTVQVNDESVTAAPQAQTTKSSEQSEKSS
ncbi:uncharacterized protein LOC135345671 isoform X3 [Halichondria panicea]|uniref:uncharacterized protein LOC135345671 isoform X3 n=1 Tax=Halichondria panicea TaxID=6063 RepID=UPI00312B9FD2